MQKTDETAQKRVEQFTCVARALAKGQAGTIFVVAGAKVHAAMVELLGQQLWWKRGTGVYSQGDRNHVSHEWLDLFLLSRCKHIVASSRLGTAAAAIAGVRPVYARHGQLIQASSEPCMVKAAKWKQHDEKLAARLEAKHPNYLAQPQCPG